MASEVAPTGIQQPLSNYGKEQNGDDTSDDISTSDLQKIISLRDVIFAGKHPRYKPAPINAWNGQQPTAPSAEPTKNVPVSRGPTHLPHRPLVGAALPTQSSQQQQLTSGTENQFPTVLLAKSDVLVKAETTLKRQRIEKDLRHQLDQRKMDGRLGMDVRDGQVVVVEDFDLEDAMQKAGIHLKPVERPEDPASANKLSPFYGSEPPRKPEDQEHAPPPAPAQSSSQPALSIQTQVPVPPQDRAPDRVPDRVPERVPERPQEERFAEHKQQFGTPPGYQGTNGPGSASRALDSILARVGENAPSNPSSRDGRVASSGPFGREHPPQTSHPDRVLNSPQPRYSATSQVRTPAAPQPVRPANMARVESQDHVIDLEAISPAGGYPRERSPPPRIRGSPPPIKQEPISPYGRDGFNGRRPFSPEQYRRPALYDHRPPPRDYYGLSQPPSFAPPPAHHYEAYPYRDERYAYPPPMDYRRPYPAYAHPQGPPPPVAYGAAPPPRPINYEYAQRYSRPPPTRHHSIRRSASPPGTFQRQRRDSRSASPGPRRAAPGGSPDPSERPHREASRPVGSPAPPARYERDEQDKPAPPMPPRGPDPYMEYRHPPPPLPRERMGYYDRDPYYAAPPPQRYADDSLMSRPESAVVPRDDYHGYREREYLAPPPGLRPPPGPPPPLGYPPRDVYARAPSVAPMHPPERPDYPPQPPQAYYSRAEAEYSGRGSVRPEERSSSYRPQSMRPEGHGGEFYAEPPPPNPPGYRSTSVRPGGFVERERYEPPGYGPSSIPPGPYMDYRRY